MIPVSLTLEGIYSYQRKVKIDFTRLTDAHIFGIFGSVGSGKSTVLEAISYALYGQSDRLNLSGDNRNYNMMNLKSNKMRIKFIFKAGKCGDQEYRFEVECTRNGKHFEETYPPNKRCFQKQAGGWIPIEKKADEILGLSYENFRRTIIIPQGKFQEFLQLKDKDRTTMLKEIFHLEKYDLYYNATRLGSENSKKMEKLKGKLEGIGEVDEKLIEEKKCRLEDVMKQVGKLTESLAEVEKEKKEHERTKELFDNIAKQTGIVSRLKDKEKDFVDRDRDLKEYENCERNFKDIINRKSEKKKKIGAAESDLKQKKEQQTKLRDDLDQKETKFSKVKKEYEEKDALKEKMDDTGRMMKIKQLDQKLRAAVKKIEDSEKILLDKDGEIGAMEQKRKEIQGAIKEHKSNMPDRDELLEIRAWFAEKNSIKRDVEKSKAEIEALKKAIGSVNKRKEELIVSKKTPGIIPKEKYDMPIDELIRLLDDESGRTEKEIEKLEEQIGELELKIKLEEFASGLEEGKPCPLCGSPEHPSILKPEDVKTRIKEVRSEKKVLDKNKKAISDLEKELGKISVREQEKRGQLETREDEFEKASNKLELHLKRFTWEKYDPGDEAGLNSDLEKEKRLRKKILGEKEKKERLKKELETARTEKKEMEKELGNKKMERTKIKTEKETLLGQLVVLKYEDHEKTKAGEMKKMFSSLKKKLKRVEKEYRNLNESISELTSEKSKLEGIISTLEGTLQGQKDELKKIDTDIGERLAKTRYRDISEVEKVLESSMDTEKERKKIDAFKQKLHTAIERLKELNRDAEGRTYDEEKHIEINRKIMETKGELDEKKEKLGSLKTDIRNLQKYLAEKAELIRELEKYRQREEDINVLKKLFKGSGFVNYISQVFLKDICNAANERFQKLTRQKLKLKLTEKNNFDVIDHLNGGKTRSAKTLSGGQTFQAALSLALALANNIQKIAGADQNFFFLDEGFGSQDRESLQIVFDTLKSLRKENRVVGIISHVEELRQEIPVHLNISNDEEKGSIIEESWT